MVEKWSRRQTPGHYDFNTLIRSTRRKVSEPQEAPIQPRKALQRVDRSSWGRGYGPAHMPSTSGWAGMTAPGLYIEGLQAVGREMGKETRLLSGGARG